MREHMPVYKTPKNYIVLTRFDHVAQTLRSNKASVQFMDYCTGPAAEYVGKATALREINPIFAGFKTMLRVDDPDHERVKKLMIPAFSQSNVMRLSSRLEKVVDSHINKLDNLESVEILSQVAQEISQDVVCDIMNIPEIDKEKLCKWTHALTMILEPMYAETEGIENMKKYLPETVEYLVTEISKRNDAPMPDDIVSTLLYEEVDGDRLSLLEVISNVGLLFMAGIETSMYFLSNAIGALLQDDQARADWLHITKNANPGPHMDPKVNNAIEELIRYAGSVWITGRAAIDDIEYDVDGKTVVVEKGSLINVVMAAANRDPRVFENPHKLDLYRENAKKNIGFSGGPHYCLGANIAKTVAAMTLTKFFTKFPDAEIIGTPVWRDRLTFRGLEELNVSLS
jgi:cytochrome P450